MAKTGLDVLVELVEQVKLLNKKLDILDQNVKVLMNTQRQVPTIAPAKPQIQQIQPAQPTPPKQHLVSPNDPSRFKGKSEPAGIPVSGRVVLMIDGKSTPIPDCQIMIYDARDQVAKQTKSNRAGTWLCTLKPGKYVAEIAGQFKGQQLETQNKTFELLEGQKLCEVI